MVRSWGCRPLIIGGPSRSPYLGGVHRPYIYEKVADCFRESPGNVANTAPIRGHGTLFARDIFIQYAVEVRAHIC